MRRKHLRKPAVEITAALATAIAGLPLLPTGIVSLSWNAAIAHEPSGFEQGQPFVIRLGDGKYYYATVERLYEQKGVEMLAYRWNDGTRFGQGYLPLSQNNESIFTLEQARRRGFAMVNEPPAAQAAAPVQSSTTPAPAEARAAREEASAPKGPLNRDEQREMVAAHNRWREKVGVPELSWSSKLAQTAQDWAKHIEQTRACRIDASAHSDRKDLGENLAYFSAIRYSNGTRRMQEVDPARVVDSWAGERKNYDYASDSCSGVCGHYTQIVWKSTEQVGCGRAICSDESQVWVCNYSPPGNFVGQKPY